MRWTSGNDCAVEVSDRVLNAITAIADEAHPLENGAALYGRYSDDGRVAFLDGVAPLPSDGERARFRFRRGLAGLAGFFRRLFTASKGESYYVGEFHSHPGGAPSPSGVDDSTQFSIAEDESCRCEAPVLVIVGGRPTNRDIGVYVYTRRRAKYALTAATAPAAAAASEE